MNLIEKITLEKQLNIELRKIWSDVVWSIALFGAKIKCLIKQRIHNKFSTFFIVLNSFLHTRERTAVLLLIQNT